jgi:Acyl-CoA dehydrogenase, C-terminal domain/SnoaL-like domain
MADIPEAGRDPGGVIRQAVENWALWRDTGRWQQLRALYTADAVVHTTWFVGTASEFVDRCMGAAKRGSRSQHFVGAVCVELNAQRAIAESRAMLLVRGAARAVDEGAADAEALCDMAKVFASEEIMKVAQHAMELHGGNGAMLDFGVEKLFRDASIFLHMDATTDISRFKIVKSMFPRTAGAYAGPE